jgi:hypothetical protein
VDVWCLTKPPDIKVVATVDLPRLAYAYASLNDGVL